MASISDLPGEILNLIADKLCESTDGIKDVAAMMVAYKHFREAEKEFIYKVIKLGPGVPWPGPSWIQQRHGRIAAADVGYHMDYPDVGYDPDDPSYFNDPYMRPLAGRWEDNWSAAERTCILALESGGTRVTSTGHYGRWVCL